MKSQFLLSCLLLVSAALGGKTKFLVDGNVTPARVATKNILCVYVKSNATDKVSKKVEVSSEELAWLRKHSGRADFAKRIKKNENPVATKVAKLFAGSESSALALTFEPSAQDPQGPVVIQVIVENRASKIVVIYADVLPVWVSSLVDACAPVTQGADFLGKFCLIASLPVLSFMIWKGYAKAYPRKMTPISRNVLKEGLRRLQANIDLLHNEIPAFLEVCPGLIIGRRSVANHLKNHTSEDITILKQFINSAEFSQAEVGCQVTRNVFKRVQTEEGGEAILEELTTIDALDRPKLIVEVPELTGSINYGNN
ncbi:hypothetical protein FJ366_03725 [Candidatus Dependentiae bacterium]|nr:hypothetical protein [Candidatus Dependentiae bacterium]